MADDENESVTNSARGADWEVVQLTASTYAAAPAPERSPTYDERSDYVPSNTMFMSDHFVFPPSEHENLPIEPDYNEIRSEPEVQDASTVEEEDVGPDETDDGGGIGLQKQNLIADEGSVYVDPEPNVLSRQNIYSPKYSKVNDGDEHDGPGLPCEAWWKRHATCLYRHAKEANTIWSVFVAASLLGLVIWGKGWQREIGHLQQLKWQIDNEVNDGDEHDGPGLPCEAWWKRHATCLYRHAKEANTIWFVFVAAALLGLVILGKRWQRNWASSTT